jgi:high-affinity K+ transport system ATPase subunit B
VWLCGFATRKSFAVPTPCPNDAKAQHADPLDIETKQALLTIADRMDALIESMDRASTSAEESARRLVILTVVLVLLTIAVAALTGWLVYDAVFVDEVVES